MHSTVQNALTAALLRRFRSVRQATLRFTAPLSAEDMMVQSSPETSPIKWHLAHTTWFFETFVLCEFVAGYQPFDSHFRWLFNSYYRALGEMPEKKLRSSFSRPSLDQILAYRRYVDAAIESLLCCVPGDESERRILLGIEHEQQHLELAATDIKNAFFTNPLHPAYRATQLGSGTSTPRPDDRSFNDAIAPPLLWHSFTPGSPRRPGIVEIGANLDPNQPQAFVFDNETPRHAVYLAPFQLSSRQVTCAEFLAFMEDDGYARPELWLSEGWDAVQAGAWQAPLYWLRDPSTLSGWSIFTLSGFLPLGQISESPVCHLSYFEADAFARWSGYRLPTEFEWEYAASTTLNSLRPQNQTAPDSKTGLPGRSLEPIEGSINESLDEPIGNFIESQHLHPQPASASLSLAYPQQLFGDVWEWTQSPYTGYPGYKPLPGALGEYNGKFMSSQMVLRGGSCVTPEAHIRATYRNFFPPSTRWQFSGLRLARDPS
ncbi:MAG: ergothioneine biosynthesis protein EgtB [Acidobacteriaceae bacterium]